jgi:hypothetical protein
MGVALLIASGRGLAAGGASSTVVVDPNGAEGYSSVTAALASGAGTVILRPGRYRETLQIQRDVAFRGEGEVVIQGAPGTAILTASGRLILENLTFEGGDVGIIGTGRWTLTQVRFKAQRRAAVTLRGGELDVKGCVLEPGAPGAKGVVALEGARLRVSNTRVVGKFGRGFELSRATGDFVNTVVEGGVTGFHFVDSKVLLSGISLSGGSGPGVFCARSSVEVRASTFAGQEYALLCNDHSEVRLRELFSTGALRAGIALVESNLDAEDVQVVGAGSFGGLHLVNAQADVRRFWIHGSGSYGLNVREGRLRLSEGAVTGVKGSDGDGDGDGVHLRQVEAQLRSLTVSGSTGAGVVAADSSTVTLRDVELRGSGQAGLIVEGKSRVDAQELRVVDSQGPGLVVLDGSRLKADLLQANGNTQGMASVDCPSGSVLELTRTRGETPPAACP